MAATHPPSLLDSLVLRLTDKPDTYLSTTLWKPRGARGVFGGHVIALALVAAGKTVPDGMGLHSQHCYFILPAKSEVDIEFQVERLRDGKSYGTRLVRALQGGRAVFVLAASYARDVTEAKVSNTPFSFIPSTRDVSGSTGGKDDGQVQRGESGSQSGHDGEGKKDELRVSHSLRFALDSTKDAQGSRANGDTGKKARSKSPSSWRQKEGSAVPPFSTRWHMPMPDNVTSYKQSVEEEVRWSRFLEKKAVGLDEKAKRYIQEYIQERKDSPVSLAVARRSPGQPPHTRMIWMRARLAPSERPSMEDVKAMIGYMTDFQFIGTAARSVGLTSASSPRLGMLASLDHTTHYYPFPPGFDASKPMLHVMEAGITDVNTGRGVVRGLLYAEDGTLIAVTSQEGVVRADNSKMKERGVTEGGGFEGGAEREVKAKL